MKPKKYVTALFIVAVLLCTLNVTAFAHDVPDLTKEGAISITMKYQGKAVSGSFGSFFGGAAGHTGTICRKAKAAGNNTGYRQ